MENNRFKIWIRSALIFCGIILFIVLFVPIWRIDLDAPQYPEGLRLLIYADKLAGNVDIINGLNHYIGMKTLHANDFIEFSVLPYIIAFYAIAFILAGVLLRKKILYGLFFLFICFGIVAMIDFWRWEYNYGHNLNPDAAIIVPGMAYQPPLIGFKQLLNFGAYSMPDVGGWIFVVVGVILTGCILMQWKFSKRSSSAAVTGPAIVILMSVMSSCNSGPVPIKVGTDNCYFCKMTISDSRFGAEILTQKGKVYKFDDVHCLLSYLQTKDILPADIKKIFLIDYCNGHQLIDAGQAELLKSIELKSPMGGNIAAFSSVDSLQLVNKSFAGTVVNWSEMYK